MIITWSKNLVTVSKCFLRVALRRYYKQACWHLAVVQEGLGPPPLLITWHHWQPGQKLQYRAMYCKIHSDFFSVYWSVVLVQVLGTGRSDLLLLIPFVLNTEHFNFKLYWIHCIAFQVRRQGLLCPLVFFGGNKGKGRTHLNPLTISQKTRPCDECKQMPDLFSDHITSKVTFFEARF